LKPCWMYWIMLGSLGWEYSTAALINGMPLYKKWINRINLQMKGQHVAPKSYCR
jgi:hypothetical protein